MAEQAHQGPVAEFCAGLARLQQGSGLDRAMLARRVGYSRSQLYEILDGRIRRPLEWDRLVLQGQMYGRASLTCDDASPVFPATRHFSSI